MLSVLCDPLSRFGPDQDSNKSPLPQAGSVDKHREFSPLALAEAVGGRGAAPKRDGEGLRILNAASRGRRGARARRGRTAAVGVVLLHTIRANGLSATLRLGRVRGRVGMEGFAHECRFRSLGEIRWLWPSSTSRTRGCHVQDDVRTITRSRAKKFPVRCLFFAIRITIQKVTANWHLPKSLGTVPSAADGAADHHPTAAEPFASIMRSCSNRPRKNPSPYLPVGVCEPPPPLDTRGDVATKLNDQRSRNSN